MNGWVEHGAYLVHSDGTRAAVDPCLGHLLLVLSLEEVLLVREGLVRIARQHGREVGIAALTKLLVPFSGDVVRRSFAETRAGACLALADEQGRFVTDATLMADWTRSAFAVVAAVAVLLCCRGCIGRHRSWALSLEVGQAIKVEWHRGRAASAL